MRTLKVGKYNPGGDYHQCIDVNTKESFQVDVMVDGVLKGKNDEQEGKIINCSMDPYMYIANFIKLEKNSDLIAES